MEFNFKLKKYDLCEQKLKKINFFDFFMKINADHLSSTVYFSTLCDKISKLTSRILWKGFKVKSHQRGAQYLYPAENGRQLDPRGGYSSHSPH